VVSSDPKSESHINSDKVFLNAITFGVSLGLLVIMICLVLNFNNGYTPASISAIFLYLFAAISALIPSIKLPLRKFLASFPLVIVAMLSFVYQGTNGSGFIYLLLFSVFYALQLHNRFVYFPTYINVIVCLIIALVIFFHWPVGAVNSLNLKAWLAHSVNFIFLNILVVVMIRQTIKSLDRTIQSKILLSRELSDEISHAAVLNTSLNATEDRYKKLFQMSPCAQLIFENENKQFIKVNQAASMIYGYTEEEFLSLSLADILSPADYQDMISKMSVGDVSGLNAPLPYKNRGKGNTTIDVEISWGEIDKRGQKATLLIVNNVSLQFEQLNAISRRNSSLKKIVHMQSHNIRMPLTKIMALNELIKEEFSAETNDRQLFDYLSKSAKELDLIIHEVIKESELILKDLDTPLLANE
jgi:PAS domain S-box-containing protein